MLYEGHLKITAIKVRRWDTGICHVLDYHNNPRQQLFILFCIFNNDEVMITLLILMNLLIIKTIIDILINT